MLSCPDHGQEMLRRSPRFRDGDPLFPAQVLTGDRIGTGDQVLNAALRDDVSAVEAMGGLEAFLPPGESCFDMEGFMKTYERLLRSTPEQLPSGAARAGAIEGR